MGLANSMVRMACVLEGNFEKLAPMYREEWIEAWYDC